MKLTYQQQKVLRILQGGGGILRFNKIRYNAALKLQELGLVVLSAEYNVSGYIFVKAVK